MKILEFDESHIKEARLIAIENYNEERSHVRALPVVETLPDLKHFADNGLGVTAFDGKRMLGFLCCFEPWDNAFNSTARGTFSPIHANGAIKENRGYIYKKLYQVAAEKWIKHKITYHAIGLYAHDNDAIDALFSYGFGLRCIDVAKTMENFQCRQFGDIKFLELPKSEVIQVREMRRMLSEHLGCSPCFMYSSPHDFQNRIAYAETRNITSASRCPPAEKLTQININGHIVGVSSGSGMAAKYAVMGGADFVLALSAGKYRDMGPGGIGCCSSGYGIYHYAVIKDQSVCLLADIF